MKLASKLLGLAGLVATLSSNASAQSCPTPVQVGNTQEIAIASGKLSITSLVNGVELRMEAYGLVSSETEVQVARVYNDGSGPASALISLNDYWFDTSSYQLFGKVSAVLGAGYTPTGELKLGYASEADDFIQVIEGTSSTCFGFPANASFGGATHEITRIGADLTQVAAGVTALNASLTQCNADKAALQTSLTLTQGALSQCELVKANMQETIISLGVRITALETSLRQRDARIAELEAQLAALRSQSLNRSVYDLSKAISSLRRTAKFALQQSRLSNVEKRMKRMSSIARLAKKANGLNIQNGDSRVAVTSTTVK